MDCNTGVQLGRQLNKDAMMMHGGMHMEPGMTEQDMLMQQPMMAPQMGGDWSQAFMAQQQRNVAAVRQQNEMEAAFAAQQHAGPQVSGPQMAGPQMASPMMMQQAMGGMMAANMGFGMMMPRTQYQPTMNLQTQHSAPQAQASAAPVVQDNAWAEQLSQQQWAQDYSKVQTFGLDGQKEATVEEKTKNSEFYTFMDRIKNREILIDEEKGEVVAGPGPEPEVQEDAAYLKHLAELDGLNMPASVFERPPQAAPTDMADEYVKDMDMAENDVEDWAKEYAKMNDRLERAMNNTDYPFEPNNPYMYHDNPYQEGMEMLQLANLAEAALAFEAVCQKEPENQAAWRVLGTTQAENEKDSLAIIALNNARKLNPGDLGVHAALSVSHTNEHNTDAAMECLRAWLLNNPEFEHLGSVTVPPEPETDQMDEGFFFVEPSRFREISTLYQAAIEMNPNDAQLYTNLGVLYNISHDFDNAAEYLRKAASLRPDDPKMWNKLGATLANGSHPEQALEAYNRALDLNPGYVRAMYNMAVAYSNLTKYPLAAKQVVRAIAVQQGGTNPTGEGSIMATRGMWELLRMTLNLMDREDLVQLSYNQDLAPFLKEFGLEGMV